MDRIREAVTRARGSREKTAELRAGSARPAMQAAARFAPDAPTDIDAVPRVHCNFGQFGRHRIISNEQDPVLNAYRVLRTKISQKMETEGWKTLAVVSPNSGAGKTVTAINLAIAMGSRQGSRAVLVDLDFYRPSIARYLGLKNLPSVLDFFEGKKALKDVAVRPDLPGMLLIGNERLSRRGAEHLTSPRADELIERSVKDFSANVVIFDLSPLLGCDDAIAFLPKVDCALMIAASGGTKSQALVEARRLVGATPVIGTVLNKAPKGLNQNYYYY